ncbi:MAG TPA: CrcB family protein [Acidimicrobiales bacterium]|nr:CrcB family protein [Acidimicrobiales bacterium]
MDERPEPDDDDRPGAGPPALPIDPDLAPGDAAAPSRTHRPASGPSPLPWADVLAVFGGGALGTLGRYAVERAWTTPPSGFPTATLVINTSGAFALAVLLGVVLRRSPRRRLVRPLLGTGLLGGWTTYSALCVEAVGLARVGHPLVAAGYLAATLVLGVGATTAGLALGPRRPRATEESGGGR